MKKLTLLGGLLSIFILTASFPAFSQQGKDNNQKDFSEFMDRKGNSYRTASGKPGEAYWQNAADYQIEVSLDEASHTLSGKVTITYTNNSPESLDFIWLQLEQNRFTPTSRGTLTTPVQGNRYNGDVDGGYQISNVSSKVGAKGIASSKHLIEDTRMQVWFTEPLPARGGKATVSMNFSGTFELLDKAQQFYCYTSTGDSIISNYRILTLTSSDLQLEELIPDGFVRVYQYRKTE